MCRLGRPCRTHQNPPVGPQELPGLHARPAKSWCPGRAEAAQTQGLTVAVERQGWWESVGA